MPFEFPQPRHMPCPECGVPIERAKAAEHECDPERRLDYDVIQLRPELDAFEDELAEYLETPRGRFERWYAEHRRDAA